VESDEHTQIWWAVRKDQEVIFHHFGIVLDSCIDVQLMEPAKSQLS